MNKSEFKSVYFSHHFTSDVDECEVNNGGCDHKCTNTDGSFLCKCNKGYRLDADKRKCTGMLSCILYFVCSNYYSKILYTLTLDSRLDSQV